MRRLIEASLRKSDSLFNGFKLRYNYIELQNKKPVDKTKACIKIMKEQMQPWYSVEILRKSHQLNRNQAFKIYQSAALKLNFGEICQLIQSASYELFHAKYYLQAFYQSFQQNFNNGSPKYQQLNLEKGNNMTTFIKIFQYLGTYSKINFNRLGLCFFALYSEQYQKISEGNYYKIASYLSQKNYLPQRLLAHMQNYTLNKNEYSKIKAQGSPKQQINLFTKISNILITMLNIEKWQKQNKQTMQDSIIKPEIRDQVMLAFFQLLGDQAILTLVVSEGYPENLFIRELLLKKRDQYLLIIDKIMDPFFLTSVRIKNGIIQAIFDVLLLYAEFTSKQRIIPILQNFTRFVEIGDTNGIRDVQSVTSLIMLCQKLQYVEQSLFYFIFIQLISVSKIANLFQVPNIRKDFQFFNLALITCYQIATVIKLIDGKNFSYEKVIQKQFIKRFSEITNLLQNNSKKITEILNQSDNIELRKKLNQSEFIHLVYLLFQKSNRILEINQLVKDADNIEKKLKIKYNKQALQNSYNPLSPYFHNGARLKALFITLSTYIDMCESDKILLIIKQAIMQNQKLVKQIKANIYFPGFAHAFILLCYQLEKIPSQVGTIKINTQLKSLTEDIIKNCQRQFKNLIVQKNKSKNFQEIPLCYYNGIQYISPPIKIDPKMYSTQNQMLEVVSKSQIINQFERYEKLREQLFSHFMKLPYAYSKSTFKIINKFVQYPFYADFLIINLAKKKNYFVMFVTPEQKERIQHEQGSEEKSKNPQNYAIKNMKFLINKGNPVFISNKEELNRFLAKL